MTYMFPVASKVPSSIPVTLIEVDADNWRRAKRTALFIARRKGISEPVVMDREMFRRMQLQMAAMHAPVSQVNPATRQPWWKQPTRIADLYDER